MSQTWMEDLESEVYESNGEADYGSESSGEADYEDFGEDARSTRAAHGSSGSCSNGGGDAERQQREAGLRRPPALPRGRCRRREQSELRPEPAADPQGNPPPGS